jgi:subtilisin family serine protease
MLVHAQRGRLARKLGVAGAAAALVVASLTAGAGSANASTAPSNVDRQLWAELADGGTTSFWVYLAEQADLTAAPINTADAPVNRVETTRWVYQELTRVADSSQAGLRAMLEARGVEHTPFWISNVIHVTGDAGLARQLAARPDVSHLEADEPYQLIEPTARVDAPIGIAAVEWGVTNINADDVWAQFGVTGQGITVASVDTGVRFTHAAVVNQYRGNLGGGAFDHNYNWFDPTGICGNTPCDNNNHGTHVTGTMVGDDGGSNQIGVAPGANWIAAKGCGSSSCASNHLLAAGQWMVAPTDLNGQNPDPSKAPHVVNNSWGGGRGDTWYQATINAWINAGIFPMFAAGNSGSACNTANSPGDNIPAYAIGAYDINNSIASFSSRGPSGVNSSVIKPNASAPGVAVRSSTAGSNTSYASFSGTSMATPHASGVVALVLSAAPGLTGDVDGVKAVLNTTARDTSNLQCGGTAANNNVFGEGRLDALAAVQLATGGQPPAPPPVASFTFTCDNATLTCTFDGSGSSSSQGTITNWDWAFGDGTTGSGQVVTHTYAASGVFQVTLEVTDSNGGTDTDTQQVAVGAAQPPTAAFVHACSPFFGFLLICDFDGSPSSDPDGTIVSYAWNFGDGTTGSGQAVSKLYFGLGPFNVTLTVTDSQGLTDSVTNPVP